MKRPLLVLIIALSILGTLALYSRFLANLPSSQQHAHEPVAAAGNFEVELTLSCDVAADPFELDQTTSLLVRMAGEDLLHRREPLSTREALRIEPVPQVRAGKNAFYVKAVPIAEALEHPQAVRVRVLRNHQLLAEQTLWSAAGEVIEGELVIVVPQEEGHDP